MEKKYFDTFIAINPSKKEYTRFQLVKKQQEKVLESLLGKLIRKSRIDYFFIHKSLKTKVINIHKTVIIMIKRRL